MKILISRHKPCTSFPPDASRHIGIRVTEKICHLIKCNNEVFNICSTNCVIKQLLQVTYVIKVSYNGEYVLIYTYDNYAARKILRRLRHPYRVVDSRRVIPSKKEINALMLYSKMRVSSVAKKLGVSKAAASKLIKRAAAKSAALSS